VVAHLWECQIIQGWNGQKMQNVLHAQDESGLLNEGDVADAFEAAWVAAGSIADVVQTTDISYLATVVRNITLNTDGLERAWQNSTDTGASGVETVPPLVALCYTFKTGFAGRSNRGRAFIGGVVHSLYASQQTRWNLTGSPGTDIAVAFDVFGTELTSRGLNHHVYSRKNGTSKLVTDYVCREGLASQAPRARRYALP
jgi:hypothetical protein